MPTSKRFGGVASKVPWKLLNEVRAHLREHGSQPSPGLVMALQMVSILLGFLGPGAVALMYGLTLTQIHKGLNALWQQ